MSLALTAQGLTTQTQAEIILELQKKIQSTFGPNTNVSPSSIMGQIINIMAELRAADQQALLDVYRSFDPSGASGTALDARAALTGSLRRGPSFSLVQGFIEFSGPGVVADGSQIQNDDTSTVWQSINGPYTDGGGPYPELVAATFQAVEAGPSIANAGTTWSVVTVLPGFSAFTNPVDDATIGQFQESDPEFRVRRGVEIYSQNIGPLLAIQGVVSKVNTDNGRVTSVRVYHNPTLSPVDADGIPFKAFNVVVETDPPLPLPQVVGPTEPLAQDIANAIFSATGAGGESYGTDYGDVDLITVLDVENQAQGPIKFDVVRIVDVFIDITINTFNINLQKEDGPIIPEEPQDMADLIRTEVATQATARFEILGRDARALDIQGIIQSLILSGDLSGIATAIVGVSLTQPAFPIPDLTALVTIREKTDYNSGAIRISINGTQY